MKPRIVCLCGSTRFGDAFRLAEFQETLSGHIVLTIGCNMKSDNDLFGDMAEPIRRNIKKELDELHLRKIDLADEVLILNVGGYIGESTKREYEYAIAHSKPVRWLEEVGAPRVRDPEALCSMFLPKGTTFGDENDNGECAGDGHYLCERCTNHRSELD